MVSHYCDYDYGRWCFCCFNFTSSFFLYRSKNKVFVAFFRYIWIGNKTKKWEKSTYIILLSSVELLSSAVLIALTTDRALCVCVRIQTRRIYTMYPPHTLWAAHINSIEKFSNNGIFNNRWKFIENPKRYNSSVTIGNGILIEGTKSTLERILTLSQQVYNKKNPNIIKVKRRWMEKKTSRNSNVQTEKS